MEATYMFGPGDVRIICVNPSGRVTQSPHDSILGYRYTVARLTPDDLPDVWFQQSHGSVTRALASHSSCCEMLADSF
jgi:hypothetical protein